MNDEEFNVRDYGATGDGITDATESFYAAYAAAVTAAPAVVFFPRGTYKIREIPPPSPGVSIRGEKSPGTDLRNNEVHNLNRQEGKDE